MADTQLQVHDNQEVQPSEGEVTFTGPVYFPSVDIREDTDVITVTADMPGARREDVTIDLHEGMLSLMAKVDAVPKNWNRIYGEQGVGGYARRFRLSERIAQDKVTARMENGVLTVTLPKADAHKPRRIEIN